jgi:membrane-associated protein
MHYSTFLKYNVLGGFLWVTGLTLAGYFFGSVPIVKDNFEYVVIGIVLISLIPIILEFAKHKMSKEPKVKAKETTLEDVKRVFEKEGIND